MEIMGISRDSVYNKEFAKKLIENGACTKFEVNIDMYAGVVHNPIRPMARIEIIINMPEDEFYRLLRKSIQENESLDKAKE